MMGCPGLQSCPGRSEGRWRRWRSIASSNVQVVSVLCLLDLCRAGEEERGTIRGRTGAADTGGQVCLAPTGGPVQPVGARHGSASWCRGPATAGLMAGLQPLAVACCVAACQRLRNAASFRYFGRNSRAQPGAVRPGGPCREPLRADQGVFGTFELRQRRLAPGPDAIRVPCALTDRPSP